MNDIESLGLSQKDAQQGSSRTGAHGNTVPVLFYTTGTLFTFFLYTAPQLLTVIFHGSPSVIKLIRLLPAFMHKQYRLSSLIFISLVGPPLTQFNPLPTLKSGWHMVIGVPMTISQESVTQRKNRATAI